MTLAIHRRPDRFRLLHVKGETDLSHLRWTVDEPRDLDLVRRIYAALYPADPAFDTGAILALLERQNRQAEADSLRQRLIPMVNLNP